MVWGGGEGGGGGLGKISIPYKMNGLRVEVSILGKQYRE